MSKTATQIKVSEQTATGIALLREFQALADRVSSYAETLGFPCLNADTDSSATELELNNLANEYIDYIGFCIMASIKEAIGMKSDEI